METPRLSVILPTLNAGAGFGELLDALWRQTLPPAEILVIDSSSTDDTVAIARQAGCRVEVIDRAKFGHGRTRNQAAAMAVGKMLVFLTQDAMPAGPGFLAALTRPVRQGRAVAAFARQVAARDAWPPERFARRFNYGPTDNVRTAADIERLGIKAFFFSNVASVFDATVFAALGGFPPDVIMNEDMLLCARLLRAGHAVAYQGSAAAIHSHNYTLTEQFRRYFDIGVFLGDAGDELAGARSTGAGLRFVTAQIAWLVRFGYLRWVLRTCLEAGGKILAVQLGKRSRLLPRAVVRQCSMHRGHWNNR